MNHRSTKFLTLALVFFTTMLCNAMQTEAPPVPEARNTPPQGLPIDDGVIYLFAVALIYGVYLVLKRTKRTV